MFIVRRVCSVLILKLKRYVLTTRMSRVLLQHKHQQTRLYYR